LIKRGKPVPRGRKERGETFWGNVEKAQNLCRAIRKSYLGKKGNWGMTVK